MSYLEEYYNSFDEDTRLLSRHNQTEYLTTMKYIEKYLKPDAKILEVGAGTGRYSLALANMCYDVTAVELIQHNIDIMQRKAKPEHNIKIHKGNAVDLSFLSSESFDMVLVFGPMYHIFDIDDKHRAISEALRVAKSDATIFVAYCSNDASVYRKFVTGQILNEDCINNLDESFHWTPNEKFLFENNRKEEIDALMERYAVERLHYVGTDLLAPFFREQFENMSDKEFELYMKYHYQLCERSDMLGFSFHLLDIFRKEKL